ncbi:hypothetical protein SNEBB_002952 [Seison nebaliae]|nr:hypothetical protein SNEBB_002952 [Seison nebaliae]
MVKDKEINEELKRRILKKYSKKNRHHVHEFDKWQKRLEKKNLKKLELKEKKEKISKDFRQATSNIMIIHRMNTTTNPLRSDRAFSEDMKYKYLTKFSNEYNPENDYFGEYVQRLPKILTLPTISEVFNRLKQDKVNENKGNRSIVRLPKIFFDYPNQCSSSFTKIYKNINKEKREKEERLLEIQSTSHIHMKRRQPIKPKVIYPKKPLRTNDIHFAGYLRNTVVHNPQVRPLTIREMLRKKNNDKVKLSNIAEKFL